MSFLRVLLVASTLVCIPVAQATLIFSFSFNSDLVGDIPGANPPGEYIPGPITGEIHLPDASKNGKRPAEKVVITGIGKHTQFGHLPLPFIVIDDGITQGNWFVGANSFSVNGTSIDFWEFDSFHSNHSNSIASEQLNLGATDGFLFPFFRVVLRNEQSSQLTFQFLTGSSSDPDFVPLSATVPAPSVLALLVIGCAGLCFSWRRRPVASR
jgi:hypothetical protein